VESPWNYIGFFIYKMFSFRNTYSNQEPEKFLYYLEIFQIGVCWKENLGLTHSNGAGLFSTWVTGRNGREMCPNVK